MIISSVIIGICSVVLFVLGMVFLDSAHTNLHLLEKPNYIMVCITFFMSIVCIIASAQAVELIIIILQ
jgi:hypothetical protein